MFSDGALTCKHGGKYRQGSKSRGWREGLIQQWGMRWKETLWLSQVETLWHYSIGSLSHSIMDNFSSSVIEPSKCVITLSLSSEERWMQSDRYFLCD